MELSYTPEQDQFRDEVRSWIAESMPATMKKHAEDGANFEHTEVMEWHKILYAKGWAAPGWPEEVGGTGWDVSQRAIFQEECVRANAPSLSPFGLSMVGPLIIQYGNEEQKKRFLPAILAGEEIWCQGYSEPNAGSDLAGLQTKATDMGDHFVVNGQKVWTSYADKADWMFCLVRTDSDGKKQMGISLLLFDMKTPGVTPKPIKLISGSSPFCETFLDDVKVDKGQVVGEINHGWTIAKYLLTHEREMIGGFGTRDAGFRSLGQYATESVGLKQGRLANQLLRNDVIRWEVDAAVFALTAERVSDEAKAGQGVGATSAMLKYYGTELNKRRFETMMKLKGGEAIEWEGAASREGWLARSWLRTKGNSIEGGTSEVQLNIIAKNILGLG